MREKSSKRRFLSPTTIWAFIATAIIFMCAAQSNVFAQTAAVGSNGSEDATVNVGGRRLRIDANTGKLRPITAEEAKQVLAGIENHVNQRAEDVRVVQGSDGSPGLDLSNAGFEAASVAKINPDGSASKECVTSKEEAQAFFGAKNKTLNNQKSKRPQLPSAKQTPETAALASRVKAERNARPIARKNRENSAKKRKDQR